VFVQCKNPSTLNLVNYCEQQSKNRLQCVFTHRQSSLGRVQQMLHLDRLGYCIAGSYFCGKIASLQREFKELNCNCLHSFTLGMLISCKWVNKWTA